MRRKKKLTILGTEYHVKYVDENADILDGVDGRCDFWKKEILVSDCRSWSRERMLKYRNTCLRHEIIHAFLYESGPAYNTDLVNHWATNEEMVDWIAIQSPKIFALFAEAGCL